MSLPNNYEVEGQLSIFDIYNHDIWSGKTLPEPSAVTKEKTSDVCLKKRQKSRIKTPLFLDLRGGAGHHQDVSWEMGGLLLGVYTMHSFGECPREENVSLLSQILEENPHQKYCLSAKACQGILRRAEKRGKELPPLLKETLLKQSASKNEPDVMGGAKESLSSMSGQEHCQPSTTKVYCLQGNGIDRADTAGCNGKGWREDQSYTLNTIDRPAVCTYQQTTATDSDHIPCVYGLDRASFNQGQNAKYDFSIEEETAQTLVSRGPGGVLSRHAVPYAQEIIKE